MPAYPALRRERPATALSRRGLLALPLIASCWPGRARAEGDTLNIGAGGAVTTLDPQFYNNAPNNALSAHIFDTITQRDGNNQVVPGLAASWRALDDTAWEFTFRPGVRWHDGTPFTADDVVFTLERIRNVPNSIAGFAGFVQAITRTEAAGPLTVRFHTAEPHPMLPIELGSVAVISRHVGAGADTADYNAGKAAIGTGPYKLVHFQASDRAVLRRNDAYWAGPQPWAQVNYRFIPNPAARTAALLSGDLDLIDQVPTGNLERFRASPALSVFQADGGRMIYLSMNFSRTGTPPYATSNAGAPLAANPFQDVRVRRAMSVAINRAGLATQLMQNTATPTGQWLPPGSFGFDAGIPVPAHDPALARQLLAEAGFPDGFRLILHTPNDRYPNDAAIAQAVAQMWTRVGVRTQVDAMPWSVFSSRSAKQDYDMRLIGWGNGTGEASYALINILQTYSREKGTGSSNSGRYSNPALDALIDRAAATLEDGRRRTLLEQATRLAMDDVAFIPLFLLSNYWATRHGLAYEPRVDEHTRAMSIRRA